MVSCAQACHMRTQLGTSETQCSSQCQRTGQSGCSLTVAGHTYNLCQRCVDHVTKNAEGKSCTFGVCHPHACLTGCKALHRPLPMPPKKSKNKVTTNKVTASRPGCKSGKTYEEAQEICKNNRMRLCTASEVKKDIGAGTGCMFDLHLVWTSDTCKMLKTATTTQPKIKEQHAPPKTAKACCEAISARCLACTKGMTVRAFCQKDPTQPGCPLQPQAGREKETGAKSPLSEQNIDFCRKKALKAMYPQSVSGMFAMRTISGAKMQCTKELAQGPVRRAVIQTIAFVRDSMVDITCEQENNAGDDRLRRLTMSTGFVWSIYTEEKNAETINALAQTPTFLDAIVNHIQRAKEVDNVGTLEVVGEVVVSETNINKDLPTEETEKTEETKVQNNDEDPAFGEEHLVAMDESTEEKTENNSDKNSFVVITGGAYVLIAVLVLVVAFLTYKLKTRQHHTVVAPIAPTIVVEMVPATAVVVPEVRVPNLPDLPEPCIQIEYSKNVASRRPSSVKL